MDHLHDYYYYYIYVNLNIYILIDVNNVLLLLLSLLLSSLDAVGSVVGVATVFLTQFFRLLLFYDDDGSGNRPRLSMNSLKAMVVIAIVIIPAWANTLVCMTR